MAAGLQQAQEEGEEEQLGLLGLDDLEQVLRDVRVVQGAGEGRVGEDESVLLLLPRVVLGQRIAVADVGVLDAMEQHVHAADAEHGVVEVEAVEQAAVEVLAALAVAEHLRMALAEVLPRGDEEARRAAGRVADHVVGRGRRHLDHQADDVARGAELAVLSGGRDLAEHVLVQVALRVPVLHGHVVDHVHDLREEGRRRDREAGVLHVAAVAGAVAAQVPEEWESTFRDQRVHFGGPQILEVRPAHVVLPLGEHAPLDRLLEAVGLELFEGVQVVEALQEQQVGDLLDDLERVRDPTRPEGVPDAVHLVAEFTGEHGLFCDEDVR